MMYEFDPAAAESRNIWRRLADVPMAEVSNQATLAWDYHGRMRQRANTWNTLDIELPSQKYRVTEELVDKINVVVASAPTWGVVEVSWPSHRSVNGTNLASDLILCQPTLPGNQYTLEGILARYADLE